MIRLRLLGSLDVFGGDGAPLDGALRRPKSMAVAAYLAAAVPRGFHRRDKLAALFWPELPTDRARAALRVTLSRLRDDLSPDIIVTRGADEVAVSADHLWCDVVALEAAVRDGRPMEAAALYRGDFLDGVHIDGVAAEFEQWIDAERGRIRRMLLESLEASGRVDAARAAVSIAPADERVNRHLIALLRATGDHADALQAFDDFARRLRRDLEIEPSPETVRLVADMRVAPLSSASSSPGRAREAIPSQPSALSPIEPAAPAQVRTRGRSIVVGGMVALAAVIVIGLEIASAHRPHEPAPRIAHWIELRNGGGLTPRARMGTHAILDSTGDALILFGGEDYGGEPKSSTILNDVWRYRGIHEGEVGEWTKLDAAGEAPAPRWLFALAYDARHDRLVLDGGARGFTSPCSNDTWILEHASGVGARPQWKRVQVTGPLPPPHAGHAAVLDTLRRRLIVVGGHDCFTTFTRDVWVLAFADSSLSAGTWTHLQPDSSAGVPLGRASYTALYDAPSDRLYIHGGNGGGLTLGDVWLLDHASGEQPPAWRPVHCVGPAPRLSSHASAYDSASDSWFITGGADSMNLERRDTWRLIGLRTSPNCRWELVPIGEPLPNARLGQSAIWDAFDRALVVQGGEFEGIAYHDVLSLKPDQP